MNPHPSRREFLRRGLTLAVAPAALQGSSLQDYVLQGSLQQDSRAQDTQAQDSQAQDSQAQDSQAQDSQAQDSLPGRGPVGTLRDPSAVGRPRTPTDPEENAAEIQAIELRLACNCGCTLDVFTCRTTDFSCTYSPRLHREVVALRSQGMTAQQVLDAFVAKYGEKALMAPKPKGFNLAGYLVPGVAIATAGAALVLLIGRRRAAVAAAGGPAAVTPDVQASPEELERLRRALAEVDD